MAKKGRKRPDVPEYTRLRKTNRPNKNAPETASIPEALNIFDNKNNNPHKTIATTPKTDTYQAEDKSNNARNAKSTTSRRKIKAKLGTININKNLDQVKQHAKRPPC